MNGILAQVAALAAHGRARRVDARAGGDAAYWSRHSTFQFVAGLRFVEGRHRLLRVVDDVVATEPSAWLAALPPDADFNLVALGSALPLAVHMAAALAGGTREGIAVSSGGRSFLWNPLWEVVARYPERKIWSVTYRRVRTRPVEITPANIEETKSRLETALDDAKELASRHGWLSSWCATFESAGQTLRSNDPVAPYHPDILPRLYGLPARQLLAAAVAAFVFGGMGSWNDVVLSGREEQAAYESVTKRLYDAVMDALVTAVNAGP